MRVDQPEEQQHDNHDQNIQESQKGFTIARRTSWAPIRPAHEVEAQNPFDSLMNKTKLIATTMTKYAVNADDVGNTSLFCPNG